MNTDIVEGNKLIGVFMGGKVEKFTWRKYDPMGITFGEEVHCLHCHVLEDLQYHTSWDWLMPVVEKIENFGFWVSINADNVNIGDKLIEGIIENKTDLDEIYIEFDSPFTKHAHPLGNSKIDATWQAVIQFIKWYNDQPKTNK